MDIITALATAFGESGISIVRISGEGSVDTAEKILSGKKHLSEYPARHMALFTLHSDGQAYDEVLAVRFEKGSSYTGEESVEIQCHGGIMPAQKCIESLCAFGARIANPGEFTRRAFVNGRIDLAQAEAVMGIIRSKSNEALAASERTLQGKFTQEIKLFLDDLTNLAAQIEINIDFPEDGEGLMSVSDFSDLIKANLNKAEKMIAKFRSGLILREGVKVSIVGVPNVGKSSLLNALLEEQRAIVTAIPGTTRDKIEELFIHKGIPIRIIDTAGIRETNDEVEALGIETALKSIDESDLCLWVIDSTNDLTEYDIKLGDIAMKHRHIIVLNKVDAVCRIDKNTIDKLYPKSKVIPVSALHNFGMDVLKDEIINTAAGGEILSESYGVSSRQATCMQKAKECLENALYTNDHRLGEDLTASSVSEARNQIAALIGLDPTENLLDKVFSEFCVGK